MELQEFKNIVSQVPLTRYLSYRDYLHAVYVLAKKSLGNFSYEIFSELMGLGRTNVSWMLIAGKRRISPRALQKIVRGLGLTGWARRYFTLLVDHNNSRLPEARAKVMAELERVVTQLHGSSVDLIAYYRNWYLPVLREMTRLTQFSSDPKWIADHFYQKLLPKQIAEGLAVLERLGLIAYSAERGRHVPQGGHIMPNPDVENMAVVRYHQQMIDVGREAITQVPSHKRDLQAVTVCLNIAGMQRVQELIGQLCRDTLEIETNVAEADAVCQLNIQFFSFTKE